MPDGGLVILDDYFPTPSTGFRVAEFTWLLEQGIASHVRTTAFPFGELRTRYLEEHPELAPTIYPYEEHELQHFELAYMVFLNNAAFFLPAMAAVQLPFVLTLYPGGGLDIGTAATDAKIAAIAESGLLRQVITTQPRTTDAIQGKFDPIVPIVEIDGVVVNPSYFVPGPAQRDDYFGSGATHLHIGFIAHKYSADGADKGYPQFIDIVRRLVARGLPVVATVIGSFQRSDVWCDDLDDVLVFRGVLGGAELRAALAELQLVISPNAPYVLAEGSFDGFPTGSCIEAALCGAAIVASDELAQNTMFRDGRDIIIEKPDAAAMEGRILTLIGEPGGIRRVARAGVATVRRHYSRDAQLEPRGAILRAELAATRSHSGE